jgi:hypothetical protein
VRTESTSLVVHPLRGGAQRHRVRLLTLCNKLFYPFEGKPFHLIWKILFLLFYVFWTKLEIFVCVEMQETRI